MFYNKKIKQLQERLNNFENILTSIGYLLSIRAIISPVDIEHSISTLLLSGRDTNNLNLTSNIIDNIGAHLMEQEQTINAIIDYLEVEKIKLYASPASYKIIPKNTKKKEK